MTAAPRPAAPIRLYGFALSGHAHRAELFLALLRLPFEKIEIDLRAGEQKSAAFLARNLFGQVPVIEDGDATVADSAAILVYLARRYDPSGRWLPSDPLLAAQVQRWFSIAAGPLVNGPARARWTAITGGQADPAVHEIAERLLGQLEQHLEGRSFLVAAHATIADLALYTYVAHVTEAGIAHPPRVREWLARIEALPGFVGMRRSAAPRAA